MINQIKSDLLEARKIKNKELIGLLTALYSESLKVGKDKGDRETNNDEVIQVIKKFIKGINESLNVSKDITKIKSLKFELDALQKYLPKQLSEDEMKDIVNKCLNDNIDNIGGIMKVFKSNYSGLFDGKKLNTIIRELL